MVTLGVKVGFWKFVGYKLAPVQEKIVAPPPGLAISVTEPELQIAPLLLGEAIGLGLTVTAVV